MEVYDVMAMWAQTSAYSHLVDGGGGGEAGSRHATLGVKHLLREMKSFVQGMRKRRFGKEGSTRRLNSAGEKKWR